MMGDYNTNKTMQMLGKQPYPGILNQNIFKELNDIAEARPYSFTKESAMDIYALGYIYGKRAERARRARVASVQLKGGINGK